MGKFLFPLSLLVFEQYLTVNEISSLVLTSKRVFDVVRIHLFELSIFYDSRNIQWILSLLKRFHYLRKLIILRTCKIWDLLNRSDLNETFLQLNSLKIVYDSPLVIVQKPEIVGEMPLSKFRNLTDLQIQNISSLGEEIHLLSRACSILRRLTIISCPRIRQLIVGDSLEVLKIEKCVQLRSVFIPSNRVRLQKVSITKCPSFRKIDFSVTNTIIENQCYDFQICDVSFTMINTESLENVIRLCPHLRNLVANNCRCLSGTLVVESNTLVHLSMENCSKISQLVVSSNVLSSLSLRLCNSLSALSVSANKLTHLDLSMLRALTLLRLACPHLTHLDISGCHLLFSPSLKLTVPSLEPTISPFLSSNGRQRYFNRSEEENGNGDGNWDRNGNENGDGDGISSDSEDGTKKVQTVRDAFHCYRVSLAAILSSSSVIPDHEDRCESLALLFLSDLQSTSKSLDWKYFWEMGTAGSSLSSFRDRFRTDSEGAKESQGSSRSKVRVSEHRVEGKTGGSVKGKGRQRGKPRSTSVG